MEGDKLHADAPGELQQLGDFGRSDGCGLIDHDVLGRPQNSQSHIEVRGVRRRHHNELDRRIAQQLIQCAAGLDAGIAFGCVVGVALDHGSELEAFDRGN